MDLQELGKIYGKKVVLIGFRGNGNLGDELILLGLVKILRKQEKSITISSNNKEQTKKFLSTYIDISKITFIHEIPRGIRSLINMFRKGTFPNIWKYFTTDSIILGGGECFTEELPNSYRYRAYSLALMMLKKLFYKGGIYITGGIQEPKTWLHKTIFSMVLYSTDFVYARDYDTIEILNKRNYIRTRFMMDAAYFALDWKSYQVKKKEKQIVININSSGQQYIQEIGKITQNYLDKGYKVFYVPIGKYGKYPDSKYFYTIQNRVHHNNNFNIINWEQQLDTFIKTLASSEMSIGTRLHLFLISEYLNIETKVFPYQKKILKMQKVIKTMKL